MDQASNTSADPRGIDHNDRATVPPSPWPVILTDRAPAPPRRRYQGAWLLAVAMIASALFSVGPAVLEIAAAWRAADSPSTFFPARWALALLWLGLVQAAYGAYLWQWNDRTSTRLVTVALVGFAGAYAASLAVVLFADPRGWIAGHAGLEFADKLPGGKAALWCLCLVSLSTSLSYLAARLSIRWQQAELLSRKVR